MKLTELKAELQYALEAEVEISLPEVLDISKLSQMRSDRANFNRNIFGDRREETLEIKELAI